MVYDKSAQSGYGTIMYSYQEYAVHQVVCEWINGKNVNNLVVRHRCNNKLCIRAEHLEYGTNTDNMIDLVQSGNSKAFKLNMQKAEKIRELVANLTVVRKIKEK